MGILDWNNKYVYLVCKDKEISKKLRQCFESYWTHRRLYKKNIGNE